MSRSPVIPLLAVLACLYGLWTVVPDVRYALAGEARPVPPGELADSTQVRLTGEFEPLGFRIERSGETREAFYAADRKVIVLFAAAPPEGETVTAEGRLHRGDRARGWGPAAQVVASRRGGTPGDYWILIDRESPAVPWGSLGLAVLLLLVLLLNFRWLRAYLRGRKSVAGPGSAA